MHLIFHATQDHWLTTEIGQNPAEITVRFITQSLVAQKRSPRDPIAVRLGDPDLILKDAKPLEHSAYKVPLAHALIRRTLLKLKGDA